MSQHYDYVIIGAGPAGLQLGYYLQKNKMSYVILERGDSPGYFYKKFPRHGQLISINKVHTGCDDPEINLRWDWNSLLSDNIDLKFKNYSTDYFPKSKDMLLYLNDFAHSNNLNIIYQCDVDRISKARQFSINAANG